jgi:hypothetical protein
MPARPPYPLTIGSTITRKGWEGRSGGVFLPARQAGDAGSSAAARSKTGTGALLWLRPTARTLSCPPPLSDELAVAVPDPLVGTARVAEFLVGAVLGHPAVVEHHDLVHLVEPV